MDLLNDLDTKTQLITFAAIGMGLSISMTFYWWRQRAIPGLGLFTLGVFCGGFGVAILVLREYIPLWISVIAGNFVICCAHIALLGGVRQFVGKRLRLAMPIASTFILSAILTYDLFTRDDIVLRSVACTLWLVVIKLVLAYECWRDGRTVAPRLWMFMSFVFTTMALVMTIRIIDILMHPDQDSFFAPSPAAGLNFLLSTVGLMVAALAAMALTNEWLQHRLEHEAAENARVAQERDQAAQTAEAANKAKSVFLAAVSHEIRTPVNAVVGGLEILNGQMRPEIGSPSHKVLTVMDKAGQSMLALLDDLLDITRMDAGRMSLSPQPVDLHQKLHDAVDMMAGRAAIDGLSLDIEIAPDVPRYVSVDASRLRQILLNLIGNAIKFTQQGGIRIDVSKREATLGNVDAQLGAAVVRIVVADTGIGIAQDKLAHIFEAFYQADAGNSRRFGGVGLGLAISKRLIDMMGGTVKVESQLGHGTVFTMDLPLALAAAPAQTNGARALAYWTGHPQVLLVEDDSVNQFVATQLLTRQGIQVTSAEDGETALRLLSRSSFQLVLMDIGMPGLDGFETTARLRASGTAMASVPVVALTANVLPETVSRSKTVGMQGFLAKPIKLEDLIGTVARFIPPDGVSTQTNVPQAATAAPLRPADLGPLASLRNRLGTQAVDTLLALASHNVAEARQHLRPQDNASAVRDLSEIRRLALRQADALDSIGFPADAQALRDCLGLLRPGLPLNTALAAMDAILADAQARLPRPRANAAE